jgi:thymidylate synthase (FAD)
MLEPQCRVTLLHHSPLWIGAHGARTCWDSGDKSDTDTADLLTGQRVCGPKDAELLDRVGNKFKHASILEHISYCFYITDISRALLQELSRHRHTSPSVKSTRYTLKELKEELPFSQFRIDHENFYESEIVIRASKYLIFTYVEIVDLNSIQALENLRQIIHLGISNDIAKYNLPEAYKTEEQLTINLRSLQNFLSLRLDKSALWEIQELACIIVHALPKEHLFLVEDIVRKALDGNPKIAELIKIFD